jgi:Tfp pilus assembly protein PilE
MSHDTDRAKLNEAKKLKRNQLIETIKTVVISVLIAGVIAFIAGVHYQSNIDSSKTDAVRSAMTASQSKD